MTITRLVVGCIFVVVSPRFDFTSLALATRDRGREQRLEKKTISGTLNVNS